LSCLLRDTRWFECTQCPCRTALRYSPELRTAEALVVRQKVQGTVLKVIVTKHMKSSYSEEGAYAWEMAIPPNDMKSDGQKVLQVDAGNDGKDQEAYEVW